MDNEITLQDCSYSVSNIYKSELYSVDRLDISRPGLKKPPFIRGMRIVDLGGDVMMVVDGVEADRLIYSFALIRNEIGKTSNQQAFDDYLLAAFLTEEFLVTEQKDVERLSSRFKEVPRALH